MLSHVLLSHIHKIESSYSFLPICLPLTLFLVTKFCKILIHIKVALQYFSEYHFILVNFQEIHEYLKAFSKHEELKNVSCLVVAVLSHGGKDGIIYGSDGNTLKDDDIRSYFSITECPLMENKPKLILIQACRGGSVDTCLSSCLIIYHIQETLNF